MRFSKMKKRLSMLAGLTAALTIVMSPITTSAQTNIDDDLYTLYQAVPEEIRDCFDENDWSMDILEASTLNRLYGSSEGEVAGVTIYNSKQIYLSDNEEYAEEAINHEMGHYFEYAYATYFGSKLSGTSEFKSIYQEEAEVSDMFSSYTISTTTEYFAQAFKWFCEDPSTLSSDNPDTYNYIAEAYTEFATTYNNGESPKYNVVISSMPDEPIGSTHQGPLQQGNMQGGTQGNMSGMGQGSMQGGMQNNAQNGMQNTMPQGNLQSNSSYGGQSFGGQSFGGQNFGGQSFGSQPGGMNNQGTRAYNQGLQGGMMQNSMSCTSRGMQGFFGR